MPNTSVSILIPTHNRGAILDRTLQSISELEIPPDVDVELVVCANACTDNTQERVAAFAGRIPGVRCVPEAKTGLGHARNRCVWASRHEVCALLDDDVWVSKGWLSGLVETYRQTAASLVAGHIELWWESVERPAWLTDGMAKTLSCLDLGSAVVEMDRPDAIGANFSFRREVFERVGPFRPDLDRVGNQLLGGGETYFVRQAMQAGYRLFYSPGASIKHWVSPHRIQAPYLTGVARGTAHSIVRLKDRFGALDAARVLGVAGARVIGYSLLYPACLAIGARGAAMNASVRRAIGLGQWAGAIDRYVHGPMHSRPHEPLTP